MDYIIQIKSEREKLLSPVYNTEQISMTQVKIPLVQPLLNGVSRNFCYETRETASGFSVQDGNISDGTNEFAITPGGPYDTLHPGDENTTIYRKHILIISTTEPNPSVQQLAAGFAGGSGLTATHDDKYIQLEHTLPWRMLYTNAIFGRDDKDFSLIKSFCPNLGPPIVYVTLGDQKEWWRSKIGEQTALMSDCECGDYFVDSIGDHQKIEWTYKGKTVSEIHTKFEWEHNGDMHPYDFMGRQWIIKITVRGEIDGRKVLQEGGEEEESEEEKIVNNISFVRKALLPRRMRDVWLVIITIVFIIVFMSMNPTQSRRTLASGAS